MATKAEQEVINAAKAWAETVVLAEQHGGEHQEAVAHASAALFVAVMDLEEK